MKISKRNAILTLANTATTKVIITVDSYHPLAFMDTAYLTARTIITNPNIELTTPLTATLADDGVLVNRFLLLSRSLLPSNNMEYSLYYDSKYQDIIAVPSFGLLENSPFIAGSVIDIAGVGINFTGISGDTMPVPNAGYAINTALVGMADSVNRVRYILKHMLCLDYLA